MTRKKTSRNAPCPCGSGKKYKHCCYGKSVEDDLGLGSEPVENARTSWYTFGCDATPRNPGQGPGS